MLFYCPGPGLSPGPCVFGTVSSRQPQCRFHQIHKGEKADEPGEEWRQKKCDEQQRPSRHAADAEDRE